jgi:DNA-binding NtrC family response regulator
MLILIAEDERITRRKLQRQLEQMGHEVISAADGAEAWQSFLDRSPPMVISDWEMPNMNGVDLVQRIRAAENLHYVYIVMLTGKSEKGDVIKGIEAGADDFVTKPFDRGELRARVNAGLRIVELEHNLASANDRLRHELAVARELSDAEHRKHEESLLGNSIPVRALREGIEQCSRTDEPLVLSGPPGAGQEAVARAIHRASSRGERAFIYVSCPHISDGNESAFGFHPREDDENQIGKASLADGGTLYLERVETLSKTAQIQLLDFLRTAASQREAGAIPRPDVRVIVSVSERRDDDSSRGGLRNDLEQALAQCRLSVPSLAERKEDIAAIAGHVLDRRARSAGKALEGLSADAKQMLQRYSWPGNIRELRSVVERAVMLASGTRVDIPEELLREGRRVGGYTLEQRLGEGGMGEVWLAKHSLLARPSAVKLIRQAAMRDDAKKRDMLEERFQREAKATAQLRSPNTVELYDFGVTDDGDFFYVMEYLQGVDLNTLVHKSGPLPPARAIHFLKQACVSLGEAHLAGLVHRDVKPENLFACKLGTQYDFLKVLDFGVVRIGASDDQTATSAGALTGSPACMSPEAAQGEEATFASDVYGLGCVAYWLLTGRRVFEATNAMQLLLQHVSQQPQPLSDFRPDLPDELEALVLRCLAKNASDRPRDAIELGEQLLSIPLEQWWDELQAQQWWDLNLPVGEISESQSDTSVTMTSDTRSSPEAGPISETIDLQADALQGDAAVGSVPDGVDGVNCDGHDRAASERQRKEHEGR